jgi:hypothetical protein
MSFRLHHLLERRRTAESQADQALGAAVSARVAREEEGAGPRRRGGHV